MFGRWTFDVRTGQTTYDDDLLAMYDVGLRSPGDPGEIQAHMHPDDLPAMQEATARALTHPAPVTGRYRIRTRSRGERVFVIAADPVRDEGTTVALAGYAIDVTDYVRVAASDAVRASAARRADIEQLKGALTTIYGLDDDLAFEVLRRHSMDANVKVVELAGRVLERLRDPHDRIRQQEGELPLLQLLAETARELRA